MIDSDNHLHDIWLVKRVVDSIFDNLKEKYSFLNYQMKENKLADSIYSGIEKNEVIIYTFISTREGYELNILEKGMERWTRKNFNFFLSKIFPPFSERESVYLKRRHEESLIYKKYTPEFYEYMISSEIDFLKKYYSEIFEKGILSK